MRLIKSTLACLMMMSLLTNSVMAQTVTTVGPTVKAVKPIDLNTPEAKHKVADLIKDADLCHLNLATTTQAYQKCSAETAPPLSFWQKPSGMIVIGLLAAGFGAFAHGYIEANSTH